MTGTAPHPIRHSGGFQRFWASMDVLSCGFRPFFLGAGVWALVGMALWPAIFSGAVTIPTAFSAVDWHAHEMIFGYGGAVMAGFLLTAVPNWTGRPPVAGAPLAALALSWVAGRVAVFTSAAIGRFPAAAIDTVFLAVLAVLLAGEVVASRNWRNLKTVGLVLVLGLVNVAFHIEDAAGGLASVSNRAALGLVVMLILVIGGRVIPSFTGNWIARMGAGARPGPFGRADRVIMVLSGASLVAWVARPEEIGTGLLLLAAGLGTLWRLSRWRGLVAWRDALVLVLHGGFLLAALGFLAAGFSALAPALVPFAVGVHVWAIGGIGMMTLAMMTRATLGHSGHALVASRATVLSYSLVVVALLCRVAMAFCPGDALVLLHLAATAWILAFAAFLAAYGPMLIRRRGA